MNKYLLVLFLTISTPLQAIDIHGSESWVEHGIIAGSLTVPFYGSEYRWWISGAVCAGFLLRESTQNGGAFNDLDSNMDWIVPCAVTSGISLIPTIMDDGFGIGISKTW